MIDILKHLRSIHFSLIATTIVLFVGLSSTTRQYVLAEEQLALISRSLGAFSAESMASAIEASIEQDREQSNFNPNPSAESFLEDGLSEHFSALAEYSDFPEIEELSVRLDSDKFESWNEYDEGDLLPLNFFKSSSMVLYSSENSYFVTFENGLDDTNIGSLIKSWDTLYSYESIYSAPDYFSQYMQKDETVLDTAGDWLDVSELQSFSEPALRVELTSVELTTQPERDKYLDAELAANASPAAWDRDDFAPDIFVLEGEIYDAALAREERRAGAVNIVVRLPAFYERNVFRYPGETLSAQFPDGPYYGRFAAGSRDFSEIFPELYASSRGLDSLNLDDLQKFLRNKSREADSNISVLGFEFRQDLLEVWGIVLLLGVSTYFWIHYSNFRSKISQGDTSDFPWIGLYETIAARTIFVASLLSPAAVIGYLIWRQHSEIGVVSGLTVLFFFLSLLIFMGTTGWLGGLVSKVSRSSKK